MEWMMLQKFFITIKTGIYHGGNLWGLIFTTGPVVKFVLLLLLFFSIISWAIIFLKIIMIRKVEKESQEFQELFWKNEKMSTILARSRRIKNSPLAQIFRAGYQELNKIIEKGGGEPGSPGAFPDNSYRLNPSKINNLHRALKRTTASEIIKLEKGLILLAITGSTTPFIGLFGTVWGIMNSFSTIGIMGSASLATVAPGIAEALIATAAGLAAAIPAVIFYNYFTKKVEVFSSEIDNFTSEFLSLVEGK